MGYVEFTVYNDTDALSKSLPLLLIDGVYSRTYDKIEINGKEVNNIDKFYNKAVNKVKITYSDNVKGLRFCDIENNPDYINRINSIIHIDSELFTDASLMFNNCKYLTYLDLSDMNVSNIINMRCMFADCINLKNIVFDKWDVKSVEDMDCMFAGCRSLTELNMDSWLTRSLKDTSWMFYRCSNLDTLYMGNFDTSNLYNPVNNSGTNNYQNMFKDVNEQLRIEIGSGYTLDLIFKNIEYKKQITCTDIILDSELYGTSGQFEIHYSILPYNVNTGNLIVTCSQNVKQISTNEFILDPTRGLDGTITFTHGAVSVQARVEYNRYIEYTLEDSYGQYLDNEYNIPYIYYMSGNMNREYRTIRVYLKDGTIETANHHIPLSEIDKVRCYYSESGIAAIKFYRPGNSDISMVKTINYINTIGFTDASYMFFNAQYLQSINLDMFDSRNIIDTTCMFYDCASIQEIKMETWSSLILEDWYRMFYHVPETCNIYVGENWYLSEFYTNFEGKFIGLVVKCTDIILSSERVILDEGKNTFKVTYSVVPSNTRDEVTIKLGTGMYNTTYDTYMIDITTTNESYIDFICGDVVKRCVVEYTTNPFIEYTVDNTMNGDNDWLDLGYTRTIINGEEIIQYTSSTLPSIHRRSGVYSKDFSRILITLNNDQITSNTHVRLREVKSVKLYYDNSKHDIIGVKFYDGEHMNYKSYVKSIKYINTSEFVDMDYMFLNCVSLESIDETMLKTDKVTTMRYMFCSSGLKKLDLSNMNVSNVVYFTNMFMGCNKLEDLNMKYWKTNKCELMTYMFSECSSLKSIDVSSFDFSTCRDIRSLFAGCKSLIELKLGEFKITNCSSLSSLFYNCESLESIDTNVINTSRIQSMSYMFSGCRNLKSLNLKNFDTSSVEDISYMFENCHSLTSIDISHFNTTNILHIRNLFSGCSSLLSMDLRNFKIKNFNGTITSLNSLFKDCTSIQAIEFTSMLSDQFPNNTYYYNLFLNVPNTCEIYTNINWNLKESDVMFSGQFNSRRPSYELERVKQYAIGYDDNGILLGYEEQLPSLITVYGDSEHTFTHNTKYKGLVSTNQGGINSLAHKCFKIDLTYSENDANNIFIECGLRCNSDIKDKFIIALSAYPDIPDISYTNGIEFNDNNGIKVISGTEKRRMSYSYYKDRSYIYSAYIHNRGVYYLHFVYKKDNRLDYIDDYALIRYIKFKTDSTYLDQNIGEGSVFDTTNYSCILDFTNVNKTDITESEIERIVIDSNVLTSNSSTNNLPKWITTGFNGKYPMLSLYKYGKYSLTNTNYNINNSSSNRYFRLNLTKLTTNVKLRITYNISSESSKDYFAIHLTRTSETPNINSYTERLRRDSGSMYSVTDRIVETTIDEPAIYYLHLNYVKDSIGRSAKDLVNIKKIEIIEE